MIHSLNSTATQSAGAMSPSLSGVSRSAPRDRLNDGLGKLNTAATQPGAVSPQLRRQFNESVGSVFYTQMIKSLRSTVGKPAYLHGGQAEELFQSQLDQVVVTSLATRDGGGLSGSLWNRFVQGLNATAPVIGEPADVAKQVAATDSAGATAVPTASAGREVTPAVAVSADSAELLTRLAATGSSAFAEKSASLAELNQTLRQAATAANVATPTTATPVFSQLLRK